MVKKILAITLVLCCVFSLFTVSAYAADRLYWAVDDGNLLIYGSGDMPDYEGEVAPWREKDKNAKQVKAIYVDDGVSHVGEQAFQYCSYAKYAQIADSVESIGESAFYGCSKLKELILPEKMDRIAVSAFDHCSALKEVIIPDGIEVIENATFNCCTSLEWVFIPDSVEEIEDSAFNACSSLKTVYYEGSWSQWEEIEIAGYNKPLTKAEIKFGCVVN